MAEHLTVHRLCKDLSEHAPPDRFQLCVYDDSSSHCGSSDISSPTQPPFVIKGQTGDWPARKRWASPTALKQYYGDVVFEVGKHHGCKSGEVSTMRLDAFLEQWEKTELKHQQESDVHGTLEQLPPYLVEYTWSKSEQTKLLDDYIVPKPFQNMDLLAAVPTSCSRWRSKYWWVGGKGSGSWLHIDHGGCLCGWNSLVFGRKRWVFLKLVNTDLATLGKEILGIDTFGLADPTKAQQQQVTVFFQEHLPKLRMAAESNSDIILVEHIQLPGDTVFVPAGWIHCVLNLDLSCAIAESFLPPGRIFEEVLWNRLCEHKPGFAHVLRECLADADYAQADQSKGLRFCVNEQMPLNATQDNFHWQPVSNVCDAHGRQSQRCGLLLSTSWFCHTWLSKKPSLEQCRRLNSIQDMLLAYEELDQVRRVLMSASGQDVEVYFYDDADSGQSEAVGQENIERCRQELIDHGFKSISDKVILPDQLHETLWQARVAKFTIYPSPQRSDLANRPNSISWRSKALEKALAVCNANTWHGEGGRGRMHSLQDRCASDDAQLKTSNKVFSRVCPKVLSEQAGIALYATGQCKCGDVLLTVSAKDCISGAEHVGKCANLDESINRETYGECSPRPWLSFHLVCALLDALERRDPRALYFQAVAPLDSLRETCILLWAAEELGILNLAGSDSADNTDFIYQLRHRADGSFVFKRARTHAESAAKIGKEWVNLGMSASPPLERTLASFFWACAVTMTRCFTLAGVEGDDILIPLIDLLNHRGVGLHTTKLRKSATATGFAIEMIANCSIDAGEEITLEYLASDADFLDFFEKYGFFNDEVLVHTVEVGLRVKELWKMVDGRNLPSQVSNSSGELVGIYEHLNDLVEQGCDRSLDSWWLPDVRLESSPLVEAISVCFGSEKSCDVADFLTSLVFNHLARYGTTTRETDEETLKELDSLNCYGGASTCGNNALSHSRMRLLLQLAVFEKRFLEKVLTSCTQLGGSKTSWR